MSRTTRGRSPRCRSSNHKLQVSLFSCCHSSASIRDSFPQDAYAPPVHAGIFLAHKRRVANSHLALIFPTETRLSPGLTINLSSNNPFRNRAESPASFGGQPSPRSPRFDVNSGNNTSNHRPVSRNPFLDMTENDDRIPPSSTRLPVQNMTAPSGASSPPKSAIAAHAKELFVRHCPTLARRRSARPVPSFLRTRNHFHPLRKWQLILASFH